jgi:hypothetical protein
MGVNETPRRRLAIWVRSTVGVQTEIPLRQVNVPFKPLQSRNPHARMLAVAPRGLIRIGYMGQRFALIIT